MRNKNENAIKKHERHKKKINSRKQIQQRDTRKTLILERIRLELDKNIVKRLDSC